MTRARAEDYEDKRQLILVKAAEHIAGKGFELTTMLEVARACGASKSHLYHYFPSKEDLLHAIVREHITVQVRQLHSIARGTQDAPQRLALFIDCFVQGAARSRNEHLILMNDLKFLPPVQREEIRRLEIEMTEMLEGLLCEVNPDLMAQQRARKPYSLLLFGMMIWTFSWYRRSGDIKPRELARRISDLFIHGFKGVPLEAAEVREDPNC